MEIQTDERDALQEITLLTGMAEVTAEFKDFGLNSGDLRHNQEGNLGLLELGAEMKREWFQTPTSINRKLNLLLKEAIDCNLVTNNTQSHGNCNRWAWCITIITTHRSRMAGEKQLAWIWWMRGGTGEETSHYANLELRWSRNTKPRPTSINQILNLLQNESIKEKSSLRTRFTRQHTTNWYPDSCRRKAIRTDEHDAVQ